MKLTQQRLKDSLSYDPALGRFTWVNPTGARVKTGHIAGSYYSNGYTRLQIDNREYLLHRLAWFYMTGTWPEAEVDHVNGVRDDNRWENLRLATKEQNHRNTNIRKDNKTGVKGVGWDSRRAKFSASICTNGKRRFVGYFKCAEEARVAITAARAQHHGDFANYGGSHT